MAADGGLIISTCPNGIHAVDPASFLPFRCRSFSPILYIAVAVVPLCYARYPAMREDIMLRFVIIDCCRDYFLVVWGQTSFGREDVMGNDRDLGTVSGQGKRRCISTVADMVIIRKPLVLCNQFNIEILMEKYGIDVSAWWAWLDRKPTYND